MMEFIRSRSKGLVMWAIVGLIIVPFALFGVQDYITGGGRTVPAVVNGADISSSQLTRAVQTRKQQLEEQLGNNYNPDMFPTDFLRQQVLNDLISRKLVSEFTQTTNMRASSKQVYNEIIKVPQFKDAEGNFSAKLYTRALAGAGRNKTAFEAEVAKDFILNQLRVGVFNSAFTLPYEIEQTQNLLNQQRNIAYLIFSKEKYKQDKSISEDELKKYYESHLSSYKTEEKIDVEYVELNINDVASKIDITEKDITEYYESNISSYTEKDYPAALIKIKSLKRRIDRGESFDVLAKEMSADGGDLGFISKGIMNKAFDSVAFSLQEGVISQPVQDDFGYHLIKVVAIKGDERKIKHILVKPLMKAKEFNRALRSEIKKDLQLQQAEARFFEDVEKFSNLAYENAGSLDAVASGLDLVVNTSGLVTKRNLQGVLTNSQVSAAIFSDQVLNENKNSDVIELKETHMIVVRIRQHKTASQKAFNEVKADVMRNVSIQRQIEAMKKDVNLAYKNLTAGEKGIDQASLFRNSKWTAAKFASRLSGRELNIPNMILRRAFSLPRPSEATPSVAIVNMPSGDQAVVIVSDVKNGISNNIAEREAISGQLQQANINTEYLGFEKYLKDRAEIIINLSKDNDI